MYEEWQDDYNDIKIIYPEIEFVKGYSDDIYESLEPFERNLFILDDQMSEASDIKSLAKLFTKGSYHRNVTILYLVQNMFNQGKSSRTVNLNSHYIVVFRNLRDQSQFRTMAGQLLPRNSQWLMDAFAAATAKSYGYLVIDNSLQCDPRYRFRTNIFRGELPTVYCNRKSVYKRPRSRSRPPDRNHYFCNVKVKTENSPAGIKKGQEHHQVSLSLPGQQDHTGDYCVFPGRLDSSDLEFSPKRLAKP